MGTLNTREVIYTPFMIRVENGMPGAVEPDLVPSSPRSLAQAVDDWCAMRGRAEHVVAEANSMRGRDLPQVELIDQPGDLRFTVALGGQWATVGLIRSGSEARLDLERSWSVDAGTTELAEPAALEDIVMKLLVPAIGED